MKKISKFILLLLSIEIAFIRIAYSEIKSYNPDKAVDYAHKWALDKNDAYNYYSGNDCANFVSQSLAAGGSDPSNFEGYTSIPGEQMRRARE